MTKEGFPATPERKERREAFEYAVRTVAARKHPTRNEDAFMTVPEQGVIGVFDGVGGHVAGDRASKAAAKAVQERVTRWEELDDADVEGGIFGELKSDLRAAAVAVQRLGDEEKLKIKDPKERERFQEPATTAVVAKLHRFEDGRQKAFIVSVGDSRAYLWRPGEGLMQITEDDDILSDTDSRHALESHFGREITEDEIRDYRMALNAVASSEQMPDPLGKALFQYRNVVAQALTNASPLHHYAVDLQAGDMLLLTSDGVHDNLAHERMADILAQTASPDQAAERLINEAHGYAALAPAKREKEKPVTRSKDDDITVFVAAPKGSS